MPDIIVPMRQTKAPILLIFACLVSVLPARAQNSLVDHWRSTSAAASGRVGVAALIIESGQTASLNGSGHFPMQSVYKLPISIAVLQRVDHGQLSIEQSVEVRPSDFVSQGKRSPLRDQFPQGTKKSIRDLIAYALIESDGTASDVLLKLAGGPQAVTTSLRSQGVTQIAIINSEKKMDWKNQYDNWSTPEAAIQILVNLQTGKSLSAESRALILEDMRKSRTGISRIRALLPAGTVVADKTGTSGTQNGVTAATNDIALITLPDGRHLALAVFVSDSKASDEGRDEVIAKIARATWDEWVSEK
jgi:beta-lactamase class A